MSTKVPCRRCGAEIHGADEDALVAAVTEHIRTVHGSSHVPERTHLLSHAVTVEDPG